MTQTKRTPHILSFDLEVSPAVGWFYPPTYETGILKVEQRQKLMSFAYQWVGDEKIHSLCLADMALYESNPQDDKLLTRELHRVMSQADILLGQNSDNFDVKMANYFFIQNDFEALPPTRTIDTKKIAKRYFKFLNNTLDNLGEELGFGGKTKVTYKELWVDAFIHGDKHAWKLMNVYCENDVDKTTKIYLKMRGFMRNHPNMALLFGDAGACPTCGGFNYSLKANRHSNTSAYCQYLCKDCGNYFRDRTAIAKPRFVA